MWNRRDAGDIHERRDAHLVLEWRKGTLFFVRCCRFVSFRLSNVLFREIRNIQNRVSDVKNSFAKHEILNKEHFLQNTKLVSHEILENFV